MDRPQRFASAVNLSAKSVDLTLTGREQFVGRQMFGPLVAGVGNAWQRLRGLVNQTSDARFVERTRVKLSVVVDPFKPCTDR